MRKYNPPFRITKRAKQSVGTMILFYSLATLIALLMGALLLTFLKVDVLRFYKEMLTIGMIGNRFAYKSIEGLIKVFVPLFTTSLALSLAFRMKYWNIGGEGQFIIGAITSSWVAIVFGQTQPPFVVLLLMAAAGGLAAGIYGAITALLKVRFGTNETLMTLMLNYIAYYLLKYFAETKGDWNIFLSTTSDRPKFAIIPEAAHMPTIAIGKMSLNVSLLIAILLLVALYLYLYKTKHGYEIAVVGDSINTAKYAGMKVNWLIVRTIFLSAFLIGMAGSFHVSTSTTLSTSITADVGWTGIIVAWLAKLNPWGIFVTAALISVLEFGCQAANTNFASVDANFANLLQGIILFCILASDFLLRYRVVRMSPMQESDSKEGKA